jgi:hypothetical protein
LRRLERLLRRKGRILLLLATIQESMFSFSSVDMVWVHLRKDRFPLLRHSKLRPRGGGPYRVLAKINDKTYSIDIPIAEFGGVSNSFSAADLSPYVGDDLGASRSTPFEGGGDDEDIPTTQPSPPTIDDPIVADQDKSNDEIRIGPITRARV